MSFKKPKRYDLEIHFKLNNTPRYMFVNVKRCRVCEKTTVFVQACGVCGRFSTKQQPVYFQPARESMLSAIPLHHEETESMIPIPPDRTENVRPLAPKRGPEDDNEPTAS
jgi:hypothetical protein